ncbi:MAG: LytR C-terminal domain-containing protein, partial [Cellulomonadaceae bacterium]|nr:LytR C-terminal domain-containing protein [Cellulomonadaceae bacterium]
NAHRQVLEQRGFSIDDVQTYTELVRYSEFRFGPKGIVAAYTLATQYPAVEMILDDRTDKTIDFIVGQRYDRPLNEDVIQFNAAEPLTSEPDCKPADELTPAVAPTPTDEATPAEDPNQAPEESPPANQ